MKFNAVFFPLLFVLFISANNTAKAQAVDVNDSLALVDLYNNTNGSEWKHQDNWLTGAVPSWYGITVTGARVSEIHLDTNRLRKTIPSSISNLTHLESLTLSHNGLNNSIPATIGNCVRLQYVDLSYNRLSAGIPSSIGNLVNLEFLYLQSNKLSDSLPSAIGNLVKLTYLVLFENQLSGSMPSSIGNLTNLQNLNIFSNRFSGEIPSSIGNLINLTYLNAPFNQLSGSIPPSIGNLINLQYIDLSRNQLSGSIPSTMGNLASLEYFYLFEDKLTGNIPPSLCNLTRLRYLYLQNNRLSDTIPSCLGNLVNVTILDLSYNRLTGFMPAALGNLINMEILQLNNNQLKGNFPPSLSNLTSLFILDASHNKLSLGSNPDFSTVPLPFLIFGLNDNTYTFNGLETVAKNFISAAYAPQAPVAIHQQDNGLSVNAGGMLTNNTYKWFKVGKSGSTIIKDDSVFHPAQNGKYYAQITNAVATQLTLTTDTVDYTMPLTKSEQVAFTVNTEAYKNGANKLLVYPNPAKGIVQVEVNGNAIIQVTDAAGKVLLTNSINTTGTLNVSRLASGMYYLQNKATGEVQKIVVSH